MAFPLPCDSRFLRGLARGVGSASRPEIWVGILALTFPSLGGSWAHPCVSVDDLPHLGNVSHHLTLKGSRERQHTEGVPVEKEASAHSSWPVLPPLSPKPLEEALVWGCLAGFVRGVWPCPARGPFLCHIFSVSRTGGLGWVGGVEAELAG